MAILFSHVRPESGEPKSTDRGARDRPGHARRARPRHGLADLDGHRRRRGRRRRRARRRAGPPGPARTGAPGGPTPTARCRAVEDSLADLRQPDDARAGVIAAYRRLLDGLDDAGAGRRDAEAPFEHVTRALSTLGVRPEPLRDLTALFAEARFSDHAITEDHRAAAVRALDEARTELQAVAGCA